MHTCNNVMWGTFVRSHDHLQVTPPPHLSLLFNTHLGRSHLVVYLIHHLDLRIVVPRPKCAKLQYSKVRARRNAINLTYISVPSSPLHVPMQSTHTSPLPVQSTHTCAEHAPTHTQHDTGNYTVLSPIR